MSVKLVRETWRPKKRKRICGRRMFWADLVFGRDLWLTCRKPPGHEFPFVHEDGPTMWTSTGEQP